MTLVLVLGAATALEPSRAPLTDRPGKYFACIFINVWFCMGVSALVRLDTTQGQKRRLKVSGVTLEV